MPQRSVKTSPVASHALPHPGSGGLTLHNAAWLVPLAFLATLLLGYHPFAEDGGIYAAAIEARLNPNLFPHDHLWVTAHTRFALFVPLVAFTTSALHVSLATTLFALQAACMLALLAAAAHLARTCSPQEQLPWLATLIVSASAGLPVAGTALYAVDPCCTARTVTTPLLLFALSFALRQQWPASVLCWATAAAMHPLMALWAALPLLVLAALETRHPIRWTSALTAFAFLAAALLTGTSSSETAATRVVAGTRNYWFPAQWRWYEWAGAIVPCIVLAALHKGLARRSAPGPSQRLDTRSDSSPDTRLDHRPADFRLDHRFERLVTALTATTLIAIALALCFAREPLHSLAVARLQPLRSLHLVFFAFLVASGALVQQRLRNIPQQLVAVAICALIAGSAFFMQRSLYAHTAHLEWPGAKRSNAWEAAFTWCRDNTPPDALFALDANYIKQPGEDSHGFRATALRSTLPDEVKDAGIASVVPALTPSWQTGASATQNLNQLTDAERRDRLRPLGVTWIVLPTTARTALPCPYRNTAAQVCRFP